MHVNKREQQWGRLGFAVALSPGKTFGQSDRVVTLRFLRTFGIGAPRIQFVDGPVKGEVVTVSAESVPAVFATEAARVIKR
jgi:hypothetical protein